MTPEGVYVRIGATSQKATDELIRQMIIETSELHLKRILVLIRI